MIWIEPKITTNANIEVTSRCCLVVVCMGAPLSTMPPLRWWCWWCRRRDARGPPRSVAPLREDTEPPLSQEVGDGDVLVDFILDQLVPLLLSPSMLPPYARLFWRNKPLPKPSPSFLSGDGDEVRQLSRALTNHPSRSG